MIPTLSRVTVLASASATNPSVQPLVRETATAAGKLGIRLDPVLVDGPADFERAFATMVKNQTQAVIVQPLFDPHRMMIIELAAKHRLATMFGYRESTVAGGLI